MGRPYSDDPLFGGFDTFVVRSLPVHLVGYAGGVVVWVLAYVVGSRAASGPAVTVAWWAALSAAAATSLYFAVLYHLAVGSPAGDLLSPALVTASVPGPVYRRLLPEGLPGTDAVVPLGGDATSVAWTALGLGFVLPLVLVYVLYLLRTDTAAWERRVMPNSFTFAGLEQKFLIDGPDLSSDGPLVKAFVLYIPLLVVFGLLLFVLPASWNVSAGDVTGLLISTLIVLYVYRERARERTDNSAPVSPHD